MNWVDRQMAKEGHMQAGPREIWQKVLTAIDDACNSFQKSRQIPEITRNTENGHAIVVTVDFPPKPYPGTNGIPCANIVRVVFDERQRRITSTLNEGASNQFNIEADENGCYINYRVTEKISPDRLSEIALSDAFFKEPPDPIRKMQEHYMASRPQSCGHSAENYMFH